MRGPSMKFQVSAISLACAMLLAGCGGGGGDEGGGAVQSIPSHSRAGRWWPFRRT